MDRTQLAETTVPARILHHQSPRKQLCALLLLAGTLTTNVSSAEAQEPRVGLQELPAGSRITPAETETAETGNRAILIQPAAGPFGDFRISRFPLFRKDHNKSNSKLEFRPSKNIPQPPPNSPAAVPQAVTPTPTSKQRVEPVAKQHAREPVRQRPASPPAPQIRTKSSNPQADASGDGWVARQAIDQNRPLRDPNSVRKNKTQTPPKRQLAVPEGYLQNPKSKVLSADLGAPQSDREPTAKRKPTTAKPAAIAKEQSRSSAAATLAPALQGPTLNEPEISEAEISEAEISEAEISEAEISEAEISEAEISETKQADKESVRSQNKPDSRIAKGQPEPALTTRRSRIESNESPAQAAEAISQQVAADTRYIGTEPRQTELDYTGRPTEEFAVNARVQRMRPGIERVLQYFYDRPEIADKRSNWGMMHSIMVYGVDTRIISGRKSYSAIGWIAGNNICRGKRLLLKDDRGITADNGVGLQGHQAQFLAVLALCNVPANYPLYADDTKYSVADLIKREMAACKSGEELTFTLIALSHYLDTETSWIADDGQRWDVARLIREELSQPIIGSACGGTHRLMGFGHALRKRRAEGRPISGQWARAEKFTADFVSYAYQLQNRDGSMSSRWFEGRADDNDVDRKIQTTGHIVEWLLTVTPDSELQNPRLVAAVNFLLSAMHRDLPHDWQIGPKGHALRSLAMYYSRVYQSGPGYRTVGVASSGSTRSH